MSLGTSMPYLCIFLEPHCIVDHILVKVQRQIKQNPSDPCLTGLRNGQLETKGQWQQPTTTKLINLFDRTLKQVIE
jgi:hypothetical protein